MILIIIFAITHYLYDFVIQPRSIATQKALSTRHMLYHILMVLCAMMVILVPFYGIRVGIQLAIYNAFAHFVIDTTIWNIYKKIRNYDTTYPYWQDKVYYNMLGLDQLLHLVVFIGLLYII